MHPVGHGCYHAPAVSGAAAERPEMVRIGVLIEGDMFSSRRDKSCFK